MRGTVAKKIRETIYGDKALRDRKYHYDDTRKALVANKDRRSYQIAKRDHVR